MGAPANGNEAESATRDSESAIGAHARSGTRAIRTTIWTARTAPRTGAASVSQAAHLGTENALQLVAGRSDNARGPAFRHRLHPVAYHLRLAPAASRPPNQVEKISPETGSLKPTARALWLIGRRRVLSFLAATNQSDRRPVVHATEATRGR
jgi:hypothetical protein